MQVIPNDFICCASRDFVCHGTFKVARLDGMKGETFFSSIFPAIILFFVFTSTVLINFSRFLKPQPTRAIVLHHL